MLFCVFAAIWVWVGVIVICVLFACDFGGIGCLFCFVLAVFVAFFMVFAIFVLFVDINFWLMVVCIAC